MAIGSNGYKYWFYFRKGLFQIFFPILLMFMSFCDFISQRTNNSDEYAYNHLYFYTSLILFLHTSAKHILEYIFSICSNDVIFKKEINLNKTTDNLILSFETESINEHNIIIIKKIFKIRYSKDLFFIYVNKICWVLGIDSPVLIPYDIIAKLTNINNNLTAENEDEFLHTTLTNLYSYHPIKYSMVSPVNEQHSPIIEDITQNLLPKVIITQLDKSINDMQKELFDKKIDFDEPNV